MIEKSLLEFVKALDQLTGANLHYLTGRDASWYELPDKYRKELIKVMDLINEFDFVKTCIKRCHESTEGELWVSDDERGTQVNFCPACGYEAKKKVSIIQENP